MMDDSLKNPGAIRGSCSLFACRCCCTKYGRLHQHWCENSLLTEPTCDDCRYYSVKKSACLHPAMRIRKEGMPYEEDQHSLRA